ncbi:MAG TPA: Gfo/Idh/MocA family oxidoreductase, partial [Planctomycetaceae bacterium]|nr:Gfo/Idh/MocA family oxidoreductase [Planctomycetaceae bacterium]
MTALRNTQRHSHRRQFLKTSAAASGAALAAGLGVQRAAHAAGSDILKVGLVGCGGRGTGAAANALTADPNCQLIALADVFPEKMESTLKSVKKRFGDRVTVDPDHCFADFDGYEKLLASGVDMVILATPPHFRPLHLKAAVDAGVHVFCEKPVAVDAPGVRSVLQTTEEADKKGLSIVSGLCWRYHFAVLETMKRVRDGAIGQIVSIQETYNTGHVGRSQPRQSGWTEMEYQLRNWYFFTWLSGDHNVEQHVHSLDKASWAMGDRPPVRAWGLGGRQVKKDPKYGDIYDHHAVVYEYENGTRVYAYCRQQPGCWNSTEDYFFGTKGTCNVLNKYQISDLNGKTVWRYRGPGCNMYEEEHRALFRAIRSGNPINNGRYMAISTMLAILGRMVTYTGQAIGWDQALHSAETLSPSGYAWDA